MLLPQSFPEHFQRLYLPNFTPPTFKEKKWTHKNKQAEETQAQSTVALDDYFLRVVNTQRVSPL